MLPLSLRTARGITYLLAAVLLTSAAGLEFYRRHSSTRERARFGLLRDDAELFTDALATSLRIPESCAEIFSGRKAKPDAREKLELKYAYDPNVAMPLREGSIAWPGTQLGHLDLTLPKDPDMRTTFDKSALRRFRARIDLDFVIKDRFPTGVPASLEVYLWLDDADTVRSCFGALSIGALCNMTGGYYDLTSTKTDARCRMAVATTIETADAAVNRGTCRVTGTKPKASECPDGARGAIPYQDKVGYHTARGVVCQRCE